MVDRPIRRRVAAKAAVLVKLVLAGALLLPVSVTAQGQTQVPLAGAPVVGPTVRPAAAVSAAPQSGTRAEPITEDAIRRAGEVAAQVKAQRHGPPLPVATVTGPVRPAPRAPDVRGTTRPSAAGAADLALSGTSASLEAGGADEAGELSLSIAYEADAAPAPFAAPADAPMQAPNDIFTTNRTSLGSVVPADRNAVVSEPSVANKGNAALMTGNQWAAVSSNGGLSWTHRSPFALPPVNGAEFCCDQEALYVASRDIFVWSLVYNPDAAGNNAVRLVIFNGETELLNDSGKVWYDFSPQNLGLPSGYRYDQPYLHQGANWLYVTLQIHAADGAYDSSVIFKVPLNELRDGLAFTYWYWRQQVGNRFTGVSGAGDTMHFARHVNNASINVHAWSEADNLIGTFTFSHTPFKYVDRGIPGGMVCVAPDGNNLCGNNDSWIKGGWIGDNKLGFIWDAGGGPSGTPGGYENFYPYIYVIRFQLPNLILLDEPIIKYSEYAWTWGAVAANARGHIGISATFVGPNPAYPPWGNVLIRDDISESAGNGGYTAGAIAGGTNAHPSGRWGDYVRVRKASDSGNTWVGTSFVLRLQSGQSCTSGSLYCQYIEPYFVWFGRERDKGPTP